ncbi:MAG TPA: hypothetical protein VMG82_16280 [Candidatus Sulfotelmatobacter sp.]|nr:hypothetical protein [Candidatus Sulfotelmatobacter sp.]
MRRMTTFLFSCVMMMAEALAQQPPAQTPEDAYTSRELIAWSHLQVPTPVPQPVRPADTQIPQPQQPEDQRPKSPADPHSQQEPLHCYRGIVVSSSNRYLLLASNSPPYQLQADQDISSFDRQHVEVLGAISADTRTIRVLRIDPLP